MQLTIDLPENLVVNLRFNEKNLSEIFEFGLREFKASSSIGYKSIAEVLEFFANLPTPKEILDLKPAKEFQTEIERLLEKNRREGLNESEEKLWASYEFIEHLVRIAKAKALKKLKK